MTRNSASLPDEDARHARPGILLPDYLVDVSAIAAAMRPYGEHPLNYLLAMLDPGETSLPILLGNAANQFMDDCVNQPPARRSFTDSMRRHFREAALDYTFSPTPPDRDFFDQARRQMAHIAEAVDHGLIPLDDVLLEPLFLCPRLGLRGRFDVMTSDHRNVVELKSGKADDWGRRIPEAKTEHLTQMLLYREILHANLGIPREEIRLKLFYSRYPLVVEGADRDALVARALRLRNGIVALLRRVAGEGVWAQLKDATPDSLNTAGLGGRLWNVYLRPRLERQLATWRTMPETERRYLDTQISFLCAEQLRQATAFDRLGETRGFARTWQAPRDERAENGRLLYGLRLVAAEGADGIDRLTFEMPEYGDDFMTDLGNGDMVLLYESPDGQSDVTTRQVTRAYIEDIGERRLTLRLAYRQRNRHFFPAEGRFSLESDYSSFGLTLGIRSLMSLPAMPARTKALLLGAADAVPAVDPRLRLAASVPGSVEAQVLAAKRAQDFFLLVGPPGSGKTSIAMRGMVADFLADRRDGDRLVLTAYTNRAVDEICAMLATLPGARYLRLGNEHACAPAFRGQMLSAQVGKMTRRDEVRALFESTPIVTGTVLALSARPGLLGFLRPACVIVDEASQVLEPALLALLAHARKFILIGDHKQLPAVVTLPPSATAVADSALRAMCLDDVRQSLFQRLHRLAERRGWNGVCATLEVQGRMHEEINRFVSRTFYGGRLRTAGLPHQTEVLPRRVYADALTTFAASVRMGFIDVPRTADAGCRKSREAEALWVARLAKALAAWHRAEGRPFDAARQLGVIVPFRSQIAAVRRCLPLPGLLVDTVECFQGSQRDFILYSTVVCERRMLDILSQEELIDGIPVDRKLNVAVSRARRAFFLVGHGETLRLSPSYAALLDSLERFAPE